MCALKLGSLFDGIGVFPLAASRNGIIPVWASEIEKIPDSHNKTPLPRHGTFRGYYKDTRREHPSCSHYYIRFSPARTCLKSESVRDWLEANQDCFFRLSEL